MNQTKLRPIYIEWVDSNAHSAWRDADEDIPTFYPIKTIGWFLKKDDEWTYVYQSAGNWNQISELMLIPNGCIKKKRFIKF